ncbi:hypothetical protein [Acinetobacter equi]|uniref:LysM domain-containing protein n=1 Tax=Acinetobacter equi TaxID=1324350 RepID=A0A0N9VCX4_9GAMM|nr:hypothetical protein [Acinetobacter equi]ALH95095.1 hypothetical protein AOY20_05820 [Acinetobacter equi]
MNTYQKIIGAIFAILGSQSLYSLSLDSIRIQSSIGDLLYAEIHFRYTDHDSPIHVSLANAHDLNTLGIKHQPPQHLNFFIRPKNHETGIITVTSSTPIYSPTLDFVIKIQNGENKRLQHIRQSIIYHPNISTSYKLENYQEKMLHPIHIVSELEITAQHIRKQQSRINIESPSQIDYVLTPLPKQPPNLNNTWITSNRQVSTSDQTPQKVITNQATITDKVLQVSSFAPPSLNQEKFAINSKETHIKNTGSIQTDIKYIVQKNDNLWLISSKIAYKHQIPISQVMKQIQLNNQHAFIRGNFNKLKNGTIITLKPILV